MSGICWPPASSGFTWVSVTAGRVLTGWIVVDMDATLITRVLAKQGAAATYKRGFGLPPAGRLVREHRRGVGDAAAARQRRGQHRRDHLVVLAAAIAAIPAAFRRRS